MVTKRRKLIKIIIATVAVILVVFISAIILIDPYAYSKKHIGDNYPSL